MPNVSNEIIAEITDHINIFGGDFSAWYVGRAHDWHSSVLEAHVRDDKGDGMICREAYTPAAPGAVCGVKSYLDSYLVRGLGKEG